MSDFAIAIVNADEAARTYQLLEKWTAYGAERTGAPKDFFNTPGAGLFVAQRLDGINLRCSQRRETHGDEGHHEQD